MMTPLLAIAVALSALGLLIMLAAAAFTPPPAGAGARWPGQLFDGGYAIFCLALTFWLLVSVLAFFASAQAHAEVRAHARPDAGALHGL